MISRYLKPHSICTRWFSEPLRFLILDGRTFLPNKHGYPVLLKTHQELISLYMKLNNTPWILMSGVHPIPGVENPDASFTAADGLLNEDESADPTLALPTPSEADQVRHRKKMAIRMGTPLGRLNYIRHLQRTQPPPSTVERLGAGYQDYLQAPLQPLAHNLESLTYEVFEQDPVKYDLYGQAIRQALIDWRQQGKPASGPDGRIVVAVVGAGRGPLVTRALQASETTQNPIDLWALEKNPNAFVLLQHHNDKNWSNQVSLVKSDMRSWKGPSRHQNFGWVLDQGADQATAGAPSDHQNSSDPIQGQNFGHSIPSTHRGREHYPIDILISELLGSFADNELSPECLDGILPLLNKTHGISIPHSYTAYLTPIATPKLHAAISARSTHDADAANTPWVVMLQAFNYLSATPAERAQAPRRSVEPTATSASTNDETRPSADPASKFAPPIPNVLPAWSFTHSPADPPAPDLLNDHNSRHAHLTFGLKDRAVCHGLVGYFEAVLYEGGSDRGGGNGIDGSGSTSPKIELSTHPIFTHRKSPGMMSWFPIFFPLKTPFYTPDHSSLEVEMWRKTDGRSVWYEWWVEGWSNVGDVGGGSGQRVRLGVSEVGSSKGEACLM